MRSQQLVLRLLAAYRVLFALSGALLVAGYAPAAAGCALCIGLPEKTLADYLTEARCVVLARQAEATPFEYCCHEVLKGDYDGAPIGLLVDSVTRRTLQREPNRCVLLTQDSPGGDWRHLGLASAEFEAIARRIVIFSAAWEGEQDRRDRLAFFLPLFGHQDRKIRELAYLEVGRAPYSVIRQLGRVSPRAAYAPMLVQRRYFEWRSLAILLVAQSDDPHDRQYVVDAFRAAASSDHPPNLAAWAAAAIEVEREAAIDEIETRYFRRADRSFEDVRAVGQALSIHGSEGDPSLRDLIVKSYGVLLQHDAAPTRQIADDLRAWKSSELTEQLGRILKHGEGLDLADRQSIRRYLHTVSLSGKTKQQAALLAGQRGQNDGQNPAPPQSLGEAADLGEIEWRPAGVSRRTDGEDRAIVDD